MNRREFLRRGAQVLAVTASAPAWTGFSAASAALLKQPLEHSSVDGLLDADLVVQFADTVFNGVELRSRTYDGSIPGPTLRVKPGDTIQLRVHNQLSGGKGGGHAMPGGFNITNFHSHGLHVSPKKKSDNPYRKFKPDTTSTVKIKIPADHPAGTFWYHPHHHGSVTVQVMGGMAGALIVEGDIDEVPEIQQAQEQILILQEIRVDEDGHTPMLDEHAFHGGTHASFPGSLLFRTVNGRVRPTIKMQPGEVQRWRIIQAGIEEFTPIALDDHTLHHIAMDGITFGAPEEVESILLAPGNRADVLVQAGEPGKYRLRKLAYDQGYGVIGSEVLATVKVEGDPVSMSLPTTLPAPTNLVPIEDDELDTFRAVSFSVESAGPGEMFPSFLLNGQLFDPNRIDFTIPLGAVEEWLISSATQDHHPFHLHTHPFQIIDLDGQTFASPRWQDTVVVPGYGLVRIRIRFKDYRGKSVFHCHTLPHEDLGMMANFEVV